MIKNKNASVLGWIICTLAAIFYCYEFLLRIEPSVMVSELMHSFHTNATEFGILVAFFYFIYTPMQIVVGLLLDLYGPRRILTVAVLACAVGSYLFGAAPTLLLAAIGRLLIGFGSAFAFVSTLKLASSWLPPKFFALFVGLATSLGMMGAIFGVIILSSLVHSIGWQQTINIGTIVGVILIPLIWLIIRDKPTSKSSNNNDNTKPQYYITFIEFLKIFKKPQMWLNGFISCLMYLSLSLFAELWGIPFLSSVYHLSAHQAAMVNSMVFLGWLIGGPLIGYISDVTYSRKAPISFGCLFAAISISLVIYLPQMNLSLLYLLLFLFGTFSSFQILCFAISSENSPKELIATASSFTNFLTMISGIAAQPLIGKILDASWSGQLINNIRIYSTTNYQVALAILPLAFFLGFILTFWLRETGNKRNSR